MKDTPTWGGPLEQTIFLFRHGEVEERYEGCCRGVTDAELSAEGERVSLQNVLFMVQQRVDLVVTTGLRRTDRVGELAAHRGLRHRVDPRLRERDFGAWEGRKWTDLEVEFPEERARMKRYEDFLPPGGESHSQFVGRVLSAWRDVLAEGLEQVAVVGHGFMNLALLTTIQNIPYGKLKQEKGWVSRITVSEGGAITVSPNLCVDAELRLAERT